MRRGLMEHFVGGVEALIPATAIFLGALALSKFLLGSSSKEKKKAE